MQGLTTCLQLTKTIEADEVFWVEYPEDGILAFTTVCMSLGTVCVPWAH